MRCTPLARALLLSATMLAAGACERQAESADEAGRVRVGIVFDIGGKDDRSFNAAAWPGVTAPRRAVAGRHRTAASRRWTSSCATSSRARRPHIEPAMRAFAERGYDLIIGIGFAQAPIIEASPRTIPNIHFAIVDGVSELPNVASLVFKEHEGSYLVGMIAAQDIARPARIGFVGGMDIGLIHRSRWATKKGARVGESRASR